METFRGYKFGNFHNVLFEGIACSATSVRNLELQTVIAHVEDFEDLISLLIKENSSLKLVTLSFYPYFATYCHEENRCNQCCSLISTFLSKNTSLRQIDISLPFCVNQLICYSSIIRSGLDQNLTLERLNVNKEIVFKRNEHTFKFELVQGHELYASQSNQAVIGNARDDGNLSVTSQYTEIHSKSVGNDIQAQCRISSCSPCMDDGNSLLASPAKQVKIGSSSSERLYQTHQDHVQHQLSPHQLQPPVVSFSSHLSTLLHSSSCAPSYFSHSATMSPQLQPHNSMPASFSIHGTYHSPSTNYIVSKEQDIQQYPSRSNTWTHSANLQPMMSMHPPLMQFPVPLQQTTLPRSYGPSFNQQSSIPHTWFHPGMGSQQNSMLLGNAATSPYQFVAVQPSITAPTIYYPNTLTPSSTSADHSISFTTSTLK